jgi:hypothetical protein
MRNYIYISACLLLLVIIQFQKSTFSETRRGAERAPSANNADSGNIPMMNSTAGVKVNGDYMKAFVVAYDAFKEDSGIAPDKRQLQNYEVEFTQDQSTYFVLFFAKRLPSERGLKGGESTLGRDVQYGVRKSDYQITSKQFFK